MFGLQYYHWAVLIGLFIGVGVLIFFVDLQWYHWVIFVLFLLVVVLVCALAVRRMHKWVYITDEEVSMLGLPPMPNDAPPETKGCTGGEKHTLFLVNEHKLNELKAYANHTGMRLKGTSVKCYGRKQPFGQRS